MSRREETRGLSREPVTQRPAKRPYHKPTVRYERVFEVQALTCGKVQATQHSCHSNRRTS